jgi:hypothetical protein
MEFFKAFGGFKGGAGTFKASHTTAKSDDVKSDVKSDAAKSDAAKSDGGNSGFKTLYSFACILLTCFIYFILLPQVYKMPYFSLPNNDKKVLYINFGVMVVLLTIYIPVGMAIFSEKEEEETTKVDVASTPEVK